MKDLQKLMNDIREWSNSTFGADKQRTIPLLHHLVKEVPEAIEACKEEGEPFHGYYEFADCFMLLLDAANHFGMTAEDLMFYTSRKLEVNKTRKWGAPDENGVIEHVDESKGDDCPNELVCQECGKIYRSNVPNPIPQICPSCYL
jgi:hypothetical protein